MQSLLKLSIVAASCTTILSCSAPAEKQSSFKFIDKANMDTTISPAEDFFKYANGAWLNNTEIPGDKTRWGSFDELRDRTNKDVHQILEEVKNTSEKAGTNKGNVGAFYKSGMNVEAIEKAGIEPIKPLLNNIASITDNKQILDVVADLYKQGVHSIIGGYIGADDKDVHENIIQFYQSGLGLPTRDYYFNADSISESQRVAYKQYMVKILTLSGANETDAVEKANNILALETRLAAASLRPVDMRDANKRYNKFSSSQFSAQTPNINWSDLLGKLGAANVDSFIVATPEYYKALSKELAATPLTTWKDYLSFHLVSDMAPYLSNDFDNARFEFYGKTLGGQKEQKPRWERVMGVINGAIGDQLGALYVEKHFKPEAKVRMVELVQNLQDAFHERITNLDWMSDITKQKAIAKLNTFIRKIGYPDAWKDYAGLEITPDNYVANILKSSAFEYNREISKLGKKVDRKEWFMTPNTVNAYYNPTYNEIVFPAAILQFPFFDFNADDAINYGGIGAVIGHEMTHGFDDQGCKYDAEGYLRNWWTDEDAKLFGNKTGIVVEQFNSYTVLDTVPVNGQLTLGENIADLGGVTIAYQAFKKTKQGQSNELIDGFTGDQRFFLSWAQIWRGKARPETARQLIATDPHSPGEWRCNGPLSNFEPFYKAFNVKEGDKMWRADSIRAKVW